MQYQLFPPHPTLSKLIMHVLVWESDGGQFHSPAGLVLSFVLYVRGGVQVEQADGSLLTYPRFYLRGPFTGPTRVHILPGTLTIAVCLRPGLLRQATGLLPENLLSTALAMYELADPARVDNLLRAMDEQRSHSDYVALFQDFLLDVLDHQKKPGIGASFVASHQKMFLPLVDLALHFGLGERQIERRVRETFGVNLRDGRRIGRFALSLLRIIGNPVSWGDLTAVAHESGYFDQAHMHREFIEFTGFAPITLVQKIASEDPAFWVYRFSREEAKKLFWESD
jgi:AraC-like DNA-binding protein